MANIFLCFWPGYTMFLKPSFQFLALFKRNCLKLCFDFKGCKMNYIRNSFRPDKEIYNEAGYMIVTIHSFIH